MTTAFWIAVVLGLLALSAGVIMLYAAIIIPRTWEVTHYVCARKTHLGWIGNNTPVVITIEFDRVRNIQRAWCMELVSGTREPMNVDKAKQLVASFTHLAKE